MLMECPGPFRKSGSPKVMCVAPDLHLASNVFQDDGLRDEDEAPVIDRHDWAVETMVEASATGLDIADQPFRAVVRELRILV